MKKRGFTLIELMAVIAVLGVIAAITIPKITRTLIESREKAYKNQINSLIDVAKRWGASNSDRLSEETCLQFSTLFDEGYIKQKDIINPKTEETLEGCIKISCDKEYSQYKYEYTDDKSFCGR